MDEDSFGPAQARGLGRWVHGRVEQESRTGGRGRDMDKMCGELGWRPWSSLLAEEGQLHGAGAAPVAMGRKLGSHRQ